MLEEVESDPWGRPYKVVMKQLKYNRTTPPKNPTFLRKIVTVLFPQQAKLRHKIVRNKNAVISPVTHKELIDACNRIGNTKAHGLDGIPNVALKQAVKSVPSIFWKPLTPVSKKESFPQSGKGKD
ncbi:unnamed protein product [Colias eurytheme]|nr:unnamed protein product [Colias eurytheme]